MRAVWNTRYGPPDVLTLRDVPAPKPGPGDVLIRVATATVTRTDSGMMRAHPFFMRPVTGLLRPKLNILGLDFAGVVEETGAGVTRYSPGDRVFGMSPVSFGAHAELLCQPEAGPMALIPDNIATEDAVICEGAWYANTNLVALELQAGQRILIYGGSGAIGSAAIQLARYYGAEVTAVVGPDHQALAAELGADRVLDYTKDRFLEAAGQYDCVFDAVGAAPYFLCGPLLRPGGVYAATDLGPWGQNVIMPLLHRLSGRRGAIFPVPTVPDDLIGFLAARLAAGELRGVFDRSFALEAVAEAYRYVETKQKTGIVRLRIPAG